MTRILSAPLFDPGLAREEIELPEGLTLEQIVTHTLPGLAPGDRAFVRVTLVSDQGVALITPEWWGQVRPKPGVRVVIRLVPGNDGLRTVLLAVVSIAAVALAGPVAGLIGLGGSQFGISLTAMALNFLGAALVNSLVPPVTPEENDRRNRYTLSGWNNQLRPDEPVPWALGRHRYAPPFAARSYTQIIGDEQYIVALFVWGYGRLKISDLRIGDTSIEHYKNVEIEHREGLAGDEPVTLYPRQVIEDGESVELVRPRPRNDAGEIISGEAIETPVVRVTASATQIATLIFWFPTGLYRLNREMDKQKSLKVEVRIRQRLSDEDDWDEVTTLALVANRDDPFFRQFSWQLPSRGRWQVEVTRMTAERTNDRYFDQVMLAAVQSVRPEYPLNFDKPLALTAIRIRATYQLNGQLDTLNGIVERYADVWDGASWSEDLSRNPAVAFIATLKGDCCPYPATDAEIDWEMMQDWFTFCEGKGLRYDRIHEQGEPLGEMLRAIASAGRASPRHDGIRWTVVIDRERDQVIDHLSPRNCSDFRWRREYLDPPHAVRVKFNDETDDWEEAERIIRWPNYAGPISLTEEMTHPGKTNPVEIYRETRRRMHEIELRPDTFTCYQAGAARTATRGDLVHVSHPVLTRAQVAARVRRVEGSLVELDAPVEMEMGRRYGLGYRVFADAEDTVGGAQVAEVAFEAGPTHLLRLRVVTDLPAVGAIVHFGLRGEESHDMIVTGIEPAKDFGAQLTLKLAAPEIETLTDAEVIPDWAVTVGDPISVTTTPPQAPRFTEIDSDNASGLDDPGTGAAWFELVVEAPDPYVIIRLAPGAGETAQISHYRFFHRLQGAGSWTELLIWAADAGTQLETYQRGDIIELQAVAVALDATEGASTSVVTHTVGADATALPVALDEETITVTGGLGHARIELAVTDAETAAVQLYRVASGGTLDPDADAVGQPVAVTPGLTTTITDGDATRTTLLGNGDFGSGAAWTLGANWTISVGQAQHTAGVADALSQAVSLTAGRTYRLAIVVTGRTAGSVTPSFTGGTTVSAPALATNGTHFRELTAVTDNDTLNLAASSDFDGAVTYVVLFRETSACVPAGAWEYHLAPVNVDNVRAALTAAFSTTIY